MQGGVECQGLGEGAQVQILVLLSTSCGTLGGSFHLLCLSFLSCKIPRR
jgi:hypothetical protein